MKKYILFYKQIYKYNYKQNFYTIKNLNINLKIFV